MQKCYELWFQKMLFLRAWYICGNRNQFQICFSKSAQSISETETGFAKLVKPNCIIQRMLTNLIMFFVEILSNIWYAIV